MCALKYNWKTHGSIYAVTTKLTEKEFSKQKYIIRGWKQISEKATHVFKGATAY